MNEHAPAAWHEKQRGYWVHDMRRYAGSDRCEKRRVSMDIEQFYDQDPRRRASDEIEFGREWSENDLRFEVSWIADTGEVYVMAEPYSRHEISPESVTVEVLGVIKTRDAISSALEGWREVMAKPNSLSWVRGRVARTSEPPRR
jgi:hypothetical protein